MKLLNKIQKIFKKKKVIQRNLRDINDTIESAIRADSLQTQALLSNLPITCQEKVLDHELIVSFTTFSKKIHDIHLVVESLALQTTKANRVILWLDEEEFSLENIPQILYRQIERGLEVKFCPNYRSYKKIIPTLDIAPEACIITIDDDVLYRYDFIETLVNAHKKNPGVIIGHRAHEITHDGAGKVRQYKEWRYSINDSFKSHKVMLTGVEGIFYPPQSLHPDVMDVGLFSKLAPSADDLWLKVMAIKQGTLCMKSDYAPKSYALKEHRDIGLAMENIRKGGNDIQFKQLLEYYPKVRDTLSK
tara:strand:- start:3599 stop:4510 length:912 start_codon:yes stop_codon:yes gene_type:complete